MHRFVFIVYFIASVLVIYAQSLNAQTDSLHQVEDFLDEHLLEYGSEDGEDSQLLEELETLARSPLNLNAASLKELEALPFLPSTLAFSIYTKRQEIGRFSNWAQLAALPGMDETILAFLRRYTFLQTTPREKSFWELTDVTLRNRFQQDDQIRRGFRDGSYPGSRMKLYNRFQFDYNKQIHGGVLIEKDPGETSLTDHLSGHISAKNIWMFDQLTFGDFTVSGGQGIVFWKSIGFSKGSEVIAGSKRSGKAVTPYLSATEAKYYRGAAAQTYFGPVSMLAFYSSNTLDANLDTLTGEIRSFDETGLHRTENELRKKGSAREQTAGARFTASFPVGFSLFSFGLSGYSSKFDHTVVPTNPSGFKGDHADMIGFDYDAFFLNSNLFGEWARSHTGAFGGVAGLTSQLADEITTTVLYRNFPADFISIHGFAFGERNGATQNERGVYFGIKLKLLPNLIAQSYFDQFSFPNRTYYIDVPSSGNDFLINIEWKPARKLALMMRYKSETKDDVVAAIDSEGRDIRPVTQRTQQNIRVELAYQPTSRSAFRARFENVEIGYRNFLPAETGFLAFADARFVVMRSLTLTGRVVTYRTDSYDSRVYEFESDLRGVLTNLGLYGQGMRMYLIANYTLLNKVNLSAKYGQTIRQGARTMGSGKDEIIGDTLGKLSMQLDVRL